MIGRGGEKRYLKEIIILVKSVDYKEFIYTHTI
jgi:hypothetical protein